MDLCATRLPSEVTASAFSPSRPLPRLRVPQQPPHLHLRTSSRRAGHLPR